MATVTASADAGPTVKAPMALPPASTPSTELANHPDYAIVREVGQGGMGVVYLRTTASWTAWRSSRSSARRSPPIPR